VAVYTRIFLKKGTFVPMIVPSLLNVNFILVQDIFHKEEIYTTRMESIFREQQKCDDGYTWMKFGIKRLPMNYFLFRGLFRREAGAHGKYERNSACP